MRDTVGPHRCIGTRGEVLGRDACQLPGKFYSLENKFLGSTRSVEETPPPGDLGAESLYRYTFMLRLP